MSGPMTHAVYIADDATHYCIRLPQWEANLANHAGDALQTVTACTTEPSLPKGLRRRKRYYQITATGQEGSVTVLSATSAAWIDPAGTALVVPLFDAATPGANNATLRGATGERRKVV